MGKEEEEEWRREIRVMKVEDTFDRKERVVTTGKERAMEEVRGGGEEEKEEKKGGKGG